MYLSTAANGRGGEAEVQRERHSLSHRDVPSTTGASWFESSFFWKAWCEEALLSILTSCLGQFISVCRGGAPSSSLLAAA